MKWTYTNDMLPAPSKRALVELSDGHYTFARRVTGHDGKFKWITDDSIPLKLPVVRWQLEVSLRETSQ